MVAMTQQRTGGNATPIASVVVTLYNGADYIEETVRSLLGQTLTDIEVLVIDDASPDDGAGAGLCRAIDDPRLRVITNERNLGVCETRNRGIEMCRGTYVAMSDQDDVSEPERLERSVARLEEEPRLAAVATAAYWLEDGRRRRHFEGGLPWWITGWRLLSKCNIVHSTICYRKATLEEYGLRYDGNYRFADDFVMFGRVAHHARLEVLPTPLVAYRVHPSANSSSNAELMTANGARWIREQLKLRVGLSVESEIAWRYWEIFGLGRAAPSESTLRRSGALYWRVLDEYVCRYLDNDWQASTLRRLAAANWWRAVMNYCKQCSLTNPMDLYRQVQAPTAPGACTVLKDTSELYLRKAWASFR